MNKIKSLIPVLLLGLFTSAFAVDTFYDKPVKFLDLPGKVLYYGTVTFDSTASGDIYYTQAFMIAGLSANNATGYFDCSEVGTEDIDVFVEYSFDRLTWEAGTTNTALDAVGTTAVQDTLNIVAGVAAKQYTAMIWMRLKFVAGQAIGATTVTWSVSIPKTVAGEGAAVANKRSS